MWNLFGRYKGKKALPSARQMNLIAAILNHVTQGTGISMKMPHQPSTDAPWIIAVDTEWLKTFVGGGGGNGPELSDTIPVAPASNPSNATAGSDTTAARGDHKHPLSTNSLAASKWVRMDSSGNLETPTEQPVAINQATYPPASTTNGLTVVTDVKWDGTHLQVVKRTLQFQKGIAHSFGTNATTNVDTPTKVVWS